MAKKDRETQRVCPTCHREGVVYVKKRVVRGGKSVTETTTELCKQCGGNGMVPA